MLRLLYKNLLIGIFSCFLAGCTLNQDPLKNVSDSLKETRFIPIDSVVKKLVTVTLDDSKSIVLNFNEGEKKTYLLDVNLIDGVDLSQSSFSINSRELDFDGNATLQYDQINSQLQVEWMPGTDFTKNQISKNFQANLRILTKSQKSDGAMVEITQPIGVVVFRTFSPPRLIHIQSQGQEGINLIDKDPSQHVEVYVNPNSTNLPEGILFSILDSNYSQRRPILRFSDVYQRTPEESIISHLVDFDVHIMNKLAKIKNLINVDLSNVVDIGYRVEPLSNLFSEESVYVKPISLFEGGESLPGDEWGIDFVIFPSIKRPKIEVMESDYGYNEGSSYVDPDMHLKSEVDGVFYIHTKIKLDYDIDVTGLEDQFHEIFVDSDKIPRKNLLAIFSPNQLSESSEDNSSEVKKSIDDEEDPEFFGNILHVNTHIKVSSSKSYCTSFKELLNKGVHDSLETSGKSREERWICWCDEPEVIEDDEGREQVEQICSYTYEVDIDKDSDSLKESSVIKMEDMQLSADVTLDAKLKPFFGNINLELQEWVGWNHILEHTNRLYVNLPEPYVVCEDGGDNRICDVQYSNIPTFSFRDKVGEAFEAGNPYLSIEIQCKGGDCDCAEQELVDYKLAAKQYKLKRRCAFTKNIPVELKVWLETSHSDHFILNDFISENRFKQSIPYGIFISEEGVVSGIKEK